MNKSILLLGLFIFVSAQADIVDQGSYTEDTATGLKWLDVTLTRNMSYDEVEAELVYFGDFQGCRFADYTEFETLLGNAGIPPQGNSCVGGGDYCGNLNSAYSEQLENLIRLLGDTYDASLDEINSASDVSPDGAGYTRAMAITPVNSTVTNNDLRTGSVYLYDSELVNRTTGEPSSDANDVIASTGTGYAKDSRDADRGALLICETSYPPVYDRDLKTIDFEEFSAPTESFIVSKSYEFSGWGSYGSGLFGDASVLDYGDDKEFAAWGYGECASWYPEASISIAREDGGPFGLYQLEGVSSITARTADGVLISGDASELGSGPWLSLNWASVSAVQQCTSYTGYVEIAIDDLIVKENFNAAIDFETSDPDNEIRPKDAYQVTVGILSTSVAAGDSYDFDATKVIPGSVEFGPYGATNVIAPQLLDIDGDTDTDLLVGFDMTATGISCFDNEVKITGATTASGVFAGKDSVTRVNCEQLVDIDFAPWSAANEVRPDDSYIVSVGVMSASTANGDARDFNATTVDPGTLRFGPAGGQNSAIPLSFDLDSDGDTDMIFGFRVEESGIACSDTDVMISGETFSGQQFIGADSITTTECTTGSCHP